MDRRRAAKTSSSDEPLEFFKVYLPSFSSHQLLIPPDFVKNFKGVVPKKAVLKNTTGRSWPIGIAGVGNTLFIKSGWRDFVIDHPLDFADFLIFRYIRDSVFLVKVFGKNGCRKEITNGVNRPLAVVKTEELADEVKEAEQNQMRPVQACKRKFVDLNIDKVENHVHRDSRFKTKLELVGETVSKCSVKTYAMPKNPHFVSRISKYALKLLFVPTSFIKRNHIKLNPNEKMIVRDQNGGTWPVQINERIAGRFYLSSGWTEFRKGNNLRVGNQLVLEFVLGEGNACSETIVRVLPPGLKIQKDPRYFVVKA
ncbi:putative B3 domain-containing protein At5g66980 [Eucalyptus grandis]|uniref:putative B3 domain-containing protein At5g66980 n=1 Tax=Eucalyptus grandis TaxID=71139 RepID=UPI00192EB4B7|nr:putative B3 domain-containing protein At5g66980 [Eucalyptus grandis]